jgi:phage-related tail protein
VKSAVRELGELESNPGQSKSWRSRAGSGRKRSNPAYVTFKADVEKMAVSIASAKEEKARLEKEMGEINTKLQMGPQVAKEYNELQSNYQFAKHNHNEIKQKLMAAQLAQGMEEEQLGEIFRVIEPAFLPEKPSKPNRLVIMLVGVVLALGVSLGTTFTREYTDKRIQDGETVEAVTGMPLLCSIPHIVSVEDQLRANRRRLALAALALLGLVGAVAAFHLLIMDLHIFYAKAARLLQTRMPI